MICVAKFNGTRFSNLYTVLQCYEYATGFEVFAFLITTSRRPQPISRKPAMQPGQFK
jgi:hypothetical protein